MNPVLQEFFSGTSDSRIRGNHIGMVSNQASTPRMHRTNQLKREPVAGSVSLYFCKTCRSDILP